MMEKQRDDQMDNIRAILIFCVVTGHVISNFGETTGTDAVYKIIFSFHMPAFLFVSGYFARYNPKKLFASLFPLYVIFQIAQYLERWLILGITDGNWEMGGFDFFIPQWTLWYLVALMMFQLLLPLFETDNKKKQAGFLILSAALGMLVGFTPDTDNFMAMSRVFVFLPFYLWGYYERKNQILRHLDRRSWFPAARGIAAAAGIVLTVGFCLFENRIVAKNFYGTDAFADGGMIAGRVFAWATAVVWILILLIWTPRRRLWMMETIGKNTLPVYLFHSLAILVLVRTPLYTLMQGRLAPVLILAAALTVLLSREPLEKLLRKVKLPYKN